MKKFLSLVLVVCCFAVFACSVCSSGSGAKRIGPYKENVPVANVTPQAVTSKPVKSNNEIMPINKCCSSFCKCNKKTSIGAFSFVVIISFIANLLLLVYFFSSVKKYVDKQILINKKSSKKR